MKRVGKDILVKTGIIVVLVVLYFLAKVISMVPTEAIWLFVKNHWVAIVVTMVLELVAKIVSEICFADEDDKDKNKTKL